MSCLNWKECAVTFRKYLLQSLVVAFYVVVLLASPILPAIFTAVLMLLYLLVRTVELCTYWTVLGRTGDLLATIIRYISFLGIITSWMGLLIVKNVRGLGHYVVLEIGLTEWVFLCLIYLAFGQALMIPRHAFLAQVRKVIEHKTKVIRLCQGFLGIYECAIFIFGQLAVMKYAPRWRAHDALGFNSWKLVQKFVLILLGVFIIKTTTRLLVLIMQFTYEDRKYVVYFAKGMRKSTDMVCISTLWITAWLVYFRPRFKLSGLFDDRRVLDFVDWSFGCFAIGTVFWLLKRFIVLKWEARVVYHRFQKKILQAAIQFHLVFLLLEDDNHKFFLWDEMKKKHKEKENCDGIRNNCDQHNNNNNTNNSDNMMSKENNASCKLCSWVHFKMIIRKVKRYLRIDQNYVNKKKNNEGDNINNENNDGTENESNDGNDNMKDSPGRKLKSAKEIFVQLEKFSVSTYQLQRSLQHFAKEEKNYLHLRKNLIYQKITKSLEASKVSNSEKLKEILEGVIGTQLDSDDAKALFDLIRSQSKQVLEGKDFEKCAEKAFRNRSELCKSIQGAKEVAKYLDKLLGGFFVVLVIIIWLLATKTAKTDLLVLISSPILAAAFIFGDTCKNIFEGIIFAFVMHLFDVGDICVIDGIQMEVNRIGIWNTTFLKLDTKEEMTYQNSSLLGTVITKRRGDSKLNDYVEYCIGTSHQCDSIFESFEKHIKECLKDLECDEHPRGVLVTEVRDSKVRIVIHFKHQPGLQDMIHHECYKKQTKTRAELLLRVKKHFDRLNSTGSTT